MIAMFITSILSLQISHAQPSMNDITLRQYGDFTKQWKLVTVRYRKDTGEMRFTYANEKAWDALSQRKFYEDGSVFAKIGFKTDVDPAFVSSAVPSGARRFQFMVRDAKKYSDTAGWGYALFDTNGQLFPDDVKTTTVSCHACHLAVPDRHYVFSEPIEFSPYLASAKPSKTFPPSQFATLTIQQLAGAASTFMKKYKLKEVEVVTGPMRKNFFSGTLDELTPLLIHQVEKMKRPAAFISEDGNTFKVAMLDKDKSCTNGEQSYKLIERRKDHKATLKAPRESRLCYQRQVN